MASGENKIQSDKKTPEQFVKAYEALCREYGYRINVNPAFISRDDGSWSVVLQTSVGSVSKQ